MPNEEQIKDLVGQTLTKVLMQGGYLYLYFGERSIQVLPERLYNLEGNFLGLEEIEDSSE